MAQKKRKIKALPSLLALTVLVLLLLLNLMQSLGWLKLNNFGIMLIYALIFFLPMGVYVKLRGKKGRALMRLQNFSVKGVGFTVVISLAICAICAVINVLSYMVFAGLDIVGQPTAMASFNSTSPMVLFFTMVVLPAVTEELLVRGILLSEYEQGGTLRAVLLTSLIFALFHAKPIHLITLFVGGMCYGLLTVMFDSVYPALFAHLLNNGAALLIYYKKEYIAYILGDALFLIFALVLVFALLITALKMTEKQVDLVAAKGKLRYYPKNENVYPYRDICLLLFALGCAVKMIWSLF